MVVPHLNRSSKRFLSLDSLGGEFVLKRENSSQKLVAVLSEILSVPGTRQSFGCPTL
jgi:hypothetical protein